MFNIYTRLLLCYIFVIMIKGDDTMKKSFLTKAISLILVTALLLIPFSGTLSFASETEKCPRIHVPGIMATDVYADINNPDGGLAWPPSTDAILNLVKDCIPALLEFSVTKDWEKLGNTISPLAYELFEPAMCDPDGGTENGTGIIFEYPTKEQLETNPNTTFRYDWRADPVVSAAQLNDYINYILEMTSAEKVAIECHSLGGVVTISYCSIYGHEKIDAVAFNSSAIFGESFTGDLLSGDIVLSNDSLMAYLDFAFDSTEQEELMSKIFDILECAGLGDLVADLGNDILANLSDILLPEVVAPLFARWLTIWAMVPDDKIDEAMEYTFTNYITEDTEGAAELRAKIENYNKLVRDNKKQTLLSIDKDCKVGVIARYGYSSIPATSSWQEVSDGVIDTKNASFGATVALYNSVLDDDIIDNTDAKYISPDKTINASTCLFPEKTWFIKGAKHSDNYDDLNALVDTILYSDCEISVDSDSRFPRFLKYDFNSDSIIPDDGTAADTTTDGILGFFAKIREFFASFLQKLRNFFGLMQ